MQEYCGLAARCMRIAVSGCWQRSGLACQVVPLGSVSGWVVIRSAGRGSVGLRSRTSTGVVLLFGIPRGSSRMWAGSAILKEGVQWRRGTPFARSNGWIGQEQGNATPSPKHRRCKPFGCHGSCGVHASTGEDLGTSAVASSETTSHQKQAGPDCIRGAC